jgi:hypothetical protein
MHEEARDMYIEILKAVVGANSVTLMMIVLFFAGFIIGALATDIWSNIKMLSRYRRVKDVYNKGYSDCAAGLPSDTFELVYGTRKRKKKNSPKGT